MGGKTQRAGGGEGQGQLRGRGRHTLQSQQGGQRASQMSRGGSRSLVLGAEGPFLALFLVCRETPAPLP